MSIMHITCGLTFLICVAQIAGRSTKNNFDINFTDQRGNVIKPLQGLDVKDLVFREWTKFLNNVETMTDKHNISGACADNLESMVQGALGLPQTQTWARRMFDAWAKPPEGILNGNVKWFGSYDECVGVKAVSSINGTEIDMRFSGQYCYTTFPVNLVMNNSFQLPKDFVPNIDIGLCVPDTCSSQDVKQLVFSLLQPIFQINSSDPIIAVCQQKNVALDTKAIIAVLLLSILALMMLIGTAYDVISGMWSDNKVTKSIQEQNTCVTMHPEEQCQPLDKTDSQNNTTTGFLVSIILAFSVYTNGRKILSTKQGAGTLTAVNGIRFLSITWVVLGHNFQLSLENAVNLTVFPELIKRWTFQAVINALVSVDTFFTMSGLLLSYLTLKEMDKKNGKINWFMFYFHRFWRLTPPYMLVLMFYDAILPHLGNGPFWPQGTFDEGCKYSWWMNLLYINNFQKMGDMCMAWTWYLSNDMQFFVISPLMIIPLFYFKNIGVIVCTLFLTASTISAGVISSVERLPPSAFGGGEENNYYSYNNLYYIRPYNRLGPYVVGILTGYLLYKTKCRVSIKRHVNIICWIVAIVLGCLIVYGLHGPLNGDPLSQGMSSLYNATNRTLWAVCVCWVIFACATGHGGFVNTLLSWSPFVPLGRLTYCVYLVHPLVILYYFYSSRSNIYVTDLSMVYIFIGHLMASTMIAFVTSLTFEAPMMGLEKVIFSRNKRA